MTASDVFRSRFTLATTLAAALWFFGFLAAGLIMNGGDLRSAGAGTLMFSFIPSSMFLILLTGTRRYDLRQAWILSIIFWAVVFISIAILSFSAWSMRAMMPEDRLMSQLWILLYVYIGQSVIAGLCALAVLAAALKQRAHWRRS